MVKIPLFPFGLNSLKTRYISGVLILLFSCVLFSWVVYSDISDGIEIVTTSSKYQLQLGNDLNEFTEAFNDIEKLLEYYPLLSNDVVSRRLHDDLNEAENTIEKIESHHLLTNNKQHNSIKELRSYLSTYKSHVDSLLESSKEDEKKSVNLQADLQANIDKFVIDLRPVVRDIRSSVNEIESDLQSMTVIGISRLDGVKDKIAVMLICGIMLVVGFSLMNFVTMKKWILNPLRLLSKDIVDKNDFTIDAGIISSEVKLLIDAMESRCKKNKEREDLLEYKMQHDHLTGLPNRIKLRYEIQSAIENSNKTGQCFSLLIIDLDRFKEINDTLGHHVGDRVLCEISNRFSAVLTPETIVARLGGDEFAVLLFNADVDRARGSAQALLKCFKKDLYLDDHRFNIGGSIGMAVYPSHAMNEHELLQRADVAMYFAKRKNFGYAIYDKSEDKHDIRQLGFEVELRDAIKNNDLALHYQPKVEVQSKQIISAEALLRWEHAEHGQIPAEEISLLAEKTGLISPLSKWVVKQSIEQMDKWKRKGVELPISINLSVWDLQDPVFFDFVVSTLNDSCVTADQITFEITESAVMSDPESAMKTLQQLSTLGANLSIDDYGTGFSSLQYLKILPIDEIKIDKSFVTDMVNYDNDAVIVRSIIDLSHNLGLKVVAEGVETQDVYDVLEILRCDVIQGYHISRPVPSEKLEHWLDLRKNDKVKTKKNNVTYLYN